MNALAPIGASALIPNDMSGAMALANMMANGRLVPSHLQKSPGDCLMVIEQAMRWGMSPFAVAQSTSVIQGKLMFEGKLVSAALHGCGMLASRMNYAFEGEGASRAVIASAVIKGETDPRTIRCTLAEAQTTNGMWKKQPDQQLVYFSTRAWARRHCPEVMLGVYSPEEFEAPAPRSGPDTFTGTTIEATAEPAPTPTAEPTAHKATISEWLADLQAALDAAEAAAGVDAILARDDVQKALDKFKNGAKTKLDDMIRDALARTTPEPVGAADDDTSPGNLP